MVAKPHHAETSQIGHDHKTRPSDPSGGGALGVKDPVCGMNVDPHTTQHRADHAGRTYYFCSAGCRKKFVAEPARYLDPKDRTGAFCDRDLFG